MYVLDWYNYFECGLKEGVCTQKKRKELNVPKKDEGRSWKKKWYDCITCVFYKRNCKKEKMCLWYIFLIMYKVCWMHTTRC